MHFSEEKNNYKIVLALIIRKYMVICTMIINALRLNEILNKGYQKETVTLLEKNGYQLVNYEGYTIIMNNGSTNPVKVNVFGDIDGLELHEWLELNTEVTA